MPATTYALGRVQMPGDCLGLPNGVVSGAHWLASAGAASAVGAGGGDGMREQKRGSPGLPLDAACLGTMPWAAGRGALGVTRPNR